MKIPKAALISILFAAALSGCATASSSPPAACVGPEPTLQAKPSQVAPSESLLLRGEDFSILGECDDTGTPGDEDIGGAQFEPQRDIPIEFRQGSKTWDLGTVDADQNSNFNMKIKVPANAVPGEAIVAATGEYETVRESIAILEDSAKGSAEGSASTSGG